MRIPKWTPVLLLLLVLAGIATVWTVGGSLTRPVPAEFNNAPKGVESVSFPSPSGSQISGWIYHTENPPVAIGVLMHGLRSNRAHMIARAEHLHNIGISSLVFDFQAHGTSTGDRITMGYLESFDAQAAVTFMKARHPGLPLLVIGVSMGGAAAVMATPALEADVLVLESVYSDVETAISNRLSARFPGGHYLTPLLSLQIKPRIGVDASRLSPEKESRRITAATLVLSGRLDQHTRMVDTKKLYEQIPEPKKLAIFDEAGHDDLERFDSKLYWKIVESFIDEHFNYSKNSASSQ